MMEQMLFYDAVVSEVNSQEYGLLKVKCPDLYEDEDSPFLKAWNIPITELGGAFMLPEKGDLVSVISQDDSNEFAFWTYPVLSFDKSKDFPKTQKTYSICMGKNQIIVSPTSILINDSKNGTKILSQDGKITLKNQSCELVLDTNFDMKTSVSLNAVLKDIVDRFYNMTMIIPLPAGPTPIGFTSNPVNLALINQTNNKIDLLCKT